MEDYENQNDTPKKDDPGEDTFVEYEGGKEFHTKTLRNGLPDLENRIKKLESEGWNIFKRGEDFVVMELIKEDQRKDAAH